MTMEKSLPYAEVTEERSGNVRKRDVFMTSWAAVATALFVMTLIGGFVYVSYLRSDCQVEYPEHHHHTKTYTTELVDNEKTEKEDVYLDEDQKTQLIMNKNKDGSISLIAGIDYNKKISVVYMTQIDECLLVSGDGLDWFDAWKAPENQTLVIDDRTRYYRADTSSLVTDLTLLPAEMRPFCQGKHMYWANADDLTAHIGRQKRASCRFACWSCSGGTCCGIKCSF